MALAFFGAVFFGTIFLGTLFLVDRMRQTVGTQRVARSARNVNGA